jgi:lysophospholipase L1-like esterase
MMLRKLGGLAAAAAVLLTSGTAAAASWTRAWTASEWAMSPAQAPVLENVTIRSAVRVGVGGQQLRIRLANDYGGNVDIGSASVRLPGGKAVPLTVGGATRFRIPEGAPILSDPVSLPVTAFDVVEVSLFFRGRTLATTVHDTSGQPVQVSGPGDFTMAGFTPASTLRHRPFIVGIDVLTPKQRPIVVAFGDSITDVTGCANDTKPTCRWSEVLGRRLAAAGKPHVVINQAISGNRVISEGAGPSALARFDRDVLAVPGVSHVVILEGINDAGNSGLTRNGMTRPVITSAQLIEGLRQLALRAHDRGIKMIAMTILPFEGAGYASPEREQIREDVNRWIRMSHTFDAVIDMEKVVADPANPKRLATELQAGDNLHPNALGETRMGEAVPLGLFH